jgi:hypothetical protein
MKYPVPVMEKPQRLKINIALNCLEKLKLWTEAVFLIMCDPSMNELLAT